MKIAPKKYSMLIFSAPSGAGKSTIVHHLLERFPILEFSISATSRAPRGSEKDGLDYYFLTEENFKNRIAKGEFIEYEEVYRGSLYGTLKSELDRIAERGHVAVFDIDVKGGLNLKQLYGESALSIFIKPPSIETLRRRLEERGTDSQEAIDRRVAKAEEESLYAEQFDYILINDDLDKSLREIESMISALFE